MKKNIVIGVLAVIILIMGGTLVYLNVNKDKITNECETNQKTENDSLKSSPEEVTNIKDDSKANEGTNEYINAVYWEEDTEVVLFDDGKCMELHVGSEYNLGTYKIENGKLILTLEVYDETQVNTYNISSDYSTITSENGYSLRKLN